MTKYPDTPGYPDLIADDDSPGAKLAADLEALYAVPVPDLRFSPPEPSAALPRRWRWWQPALAAAVAVAGLAAALLAPSLWEGESRVNAQDILQRAIAVAETNIPATGAVPYHLVATTTTPGQASPTRTEMWFADASHIRVEKEFDAFNGTPERGFLISGDLTWMFDAQGEYRAVRGPTSELGSARLFPGRPSLDIAASSLAQVLGQHTEGCQVAREDGEEAVAGRTAYKIVVGPVACMEADELLEFGRLIVWVDKESFLPLRAVEQYGLGEQVLYSYEVTQLDYGDPIPESVFIYEGPPGTTVQDVSNLSEASNVLSGDTPEGVVASPEGVVPSLVVESGQVQAGDSITVRVVLEASKPGIGSFTVDLYHDPNLLTAVSCDSNPAGVCNAQYQQQVSRFVGATGTRWVGEIEVGSVTFQAAVGAQGTSSLDAIVVTLSDPYGHDLQPDQIRNGVIEVIPPDNPD